MREWLVAYVNAYRADSMEETVVYDDTKRPVRSSDAFRALLAEPMLAGLDSEPFAAMLATPRSARPQAVGSRISWEFDHPSGLKPLLEVLERSMYSSPARPDVNWMTTKLLYASHYFESQLDFMTVADAPSSPGSGAMYIVVLRRSKFDDLPSGGLFNIRGRAVRKLRDALRTTLVEYARGARERVRRFGVATTSRPLSRTLRTLLSSIHMTIRRPLGMLALLAMAHFIIVGTAAACSTPRGDSRMASPAHADCAPSSQHSRGDSTDRTTETPCCAALASCAAAPVAARTIAFAVSAPMVTLASAISERAPRAEVPAPELPPPKA